MKDYNSKMYKFRLKINKRKLKWMIKVGKYLLNPNNKIMITNKL